jgi:hypothetical protein
MRTIQKLIGSEYVDLESGDVDRLTAINRIKELSDGDSLSKYRIIKSVVDWDGAEYESLGSLTVGSMVINEKKNRRGRVIAFDKTKTKAMVEFDLENAHPRHRRRHELLKGTDVAEVLKFVEWISVKNIRLAL